MRQYMGRVLQVGLFVGVFAGGYLCGTVTQQRADAQLGDLGQKAMEKAGESGGALGGAVQLGQSIVDMQQHVDGLQKNLEVLKKIKSGLGG